MKRIKPGRLAGEFTTKFKTKVVLAALSERYTLAQLSEKYEIHRNQISQWKHQFIANADMIFSKASKSKKEHSNSFTRIISISEPWF